MTTAISLKQSKASVQSLLLAFCLLFALSGAVIASQSAPININQASAETIAEVMVGVGKRKAQAIVAYREQHGPFKALDDLVAVKGIGKKTLAKNRELLSLK